METPIGEGTVIRQYLGHYHVASGSTIIDCALSTRLRKQLQYPEASPGSRRRRVQSVRRVRVVDPVAIGDQVRFEEGEGGTGMICEVMPRRNKVSRRASGGSRKEQILAANVDQVLPIFSAAAPPPEWDLLDRMLAIAEWEEVPAVICFNKIDLTDEVAAREAMAGYERIGYRVVYTSVTADMGKEAFQDVLQNRVSLMMGPSGVGKSSLLNWLQPGLKLRTAGVSPATGGGRHTTTHLELVKLAGGGLVGDIPGVREFYLWDVEPEDVPALFKEFQDLIGQCRFRDCSHIHEPECAIKEAVEAGNIVPARYANYLRLRENP